MCPEYKGKANVPSHSKKEKTCTTCGGKGVVVEIRHYAKTLCIGGYNIFRILDDIVMRFRADGREMQGIGTLNTDDTDSDGFTQIFHYP